MIVGLILFLLLTTMPLVYASEELEEVIESTDMSDVTLESVIEGTVDTFNELKDDPLFIIFVVLVLIIALGLILKRVQHTPITVWERGSFGIAIFSVLFLGILLLAKHFIGTRDVILFLNPAINPLAMIFITSLGIYLLIKVFPR